jgi:hypothetical protein
MQEGLNAFEGAALPSNYHHKHTNENKLRAKKVPPEIIPSLYTDSKDHTRKIKLRENHSTITTSFQFNQTQEKSHDGENRANLKVLNPTLLPLHSKSSVDNVTERDFIPRFLLREDLERMMECSSIDVNFQPLGTWNSRQIKKSAKCEENGTDVGPQHYHISSSFMNQGFSVVSHSPAEAISILFRGVSSVQILYEADDLVLTSVRTCVRNLSIPYDLNEESLGAQFVTISTPWPCKKVEVVVTERREEFICIFNVKTYSTKNI